MTKKFDSSVGFFWSAKHSQIYPELAALTKEQLVTYEVVTQTSKPNKKVYTITSAGTAALEAWVANTGEKRNIKDPLLMRIWVVGMVDPRSALKQLRDADQEYMRRGEHLQCMMAQTRLNQSHEAVPTNSWLGAYLALDCGIKQHEAYHLWIRESITTLEKLEASLPRNEVAPIG